jgi:hypothetical protein
MKNEAHAITAGMVKIGLCALKERIDAHANTPSETAAAITCTVFDDCIETSTIFTFKTNAAMGIAIANKTFCHFPLSPCCYYSSIYVVSQR